MASSAPYCGPCPNPKRHLPQQQVENNLDRYTYTATAVNTYHYMYTYVLVKGIKGMAKAMTHKEIEFRPAGILYI